MTSNKFDTSKRIEITREFLGGLNCHDQGLTLLPLFDLLTSGQIHPYRIPHKGKTAMAFADAIHGPRQRADELIQERAHARFDNIVDRYFKFNGLINAPADTDDANWKSIASAYLVMTKCVHLVTDPNNRLLHRLTPEFLDAYFGATGGHHVS